MREGTDHGPTSRSHRIDGGPDVRIRLHLGWPPVVHRSIRAVLSLSNFFRASDFPDFPRSGKLI